MSNRKAFTLIEILVCFAIVAVLVGLLVVAVQRARETAARTESENNLRQIILASHSFATAHNGRFPSLDGNWGSASWEEYGGYGLLVAIRPYLEQEFQPPPELTDATLSYPSLPVVALYLSPADPSVNRANPQPLSSYAVNAQAFQGDPQLLSFRDGLSNTIAFAEHYSTNCGDTGWELNFGYVLGMMPTGNDGVNQFRRASFADGGSLILVNSTCGDEYPDPETGEYPNVTFQVAPPISACNLQVPQTPHRSGMLVALADGSCRTISPSITPATFWAAVTPAGADPLGDDWNQ